MKIFSSALKFLNANVSLPSPTLPLSSSFLGDKQNESLLCRGRAVCSYLAETVPASGLGQRASPWFSLRGACVGCSSTFLRIGGRVAVAHAGVGN